jgi:hypothetical protein
MATEKQDYFEFKLGLIERTISLYIQRMDIWEDQFYKIKYGCMAVILTLLGFRYTTSPDAPFLSYMALIATIVFWLFESTLRTTFFRYIAKLDLLTEIINNKTLMQYLRQLCSRSWLKNGVNHAQTGNLLKNLGQ